MRDEGSEAFGGVTLAELAALVAIVLLFQRLSTPSGDARTSPVRIGPRSSSGRMSLGDVRALAARIGFPDPDTAAAVAMAESAGDPAARGDSGQSLGLWQINVPAHPEYASANMLDPDANARAALVISAGGRNWQPWTQYTNGAFRRFMPNA